MANIFQDCVAENCENGFVTYPDANVTIVGAKAIGCTTGFESKDRDPQLFAKIEHAISQIPDQDVRDDWLARLAQLGRDGALVVASDTRAAFVGATLIAFAHRLGIAI